MSRGCDWVCSGQAQGAECALDGRGAVVPGHETSNILERTLLANVITDVDDTKQNSQFCTDVCWL